MERKVLLVILSLSEGSVFFPRIFPKIFHFRCSGNVLDSFSALLYTQKQKNRERPVGKEGYYDQKDNSDR